MSSMRRYPLEPLLRAGGYEPYDRDAPGVNTVEVIASVLGTSPRQVLRWAKQGVPDDVADRAAVKLAGRTPAEVWPEWGDVQVGVDAPEYWAVAFTCPTCGVGVRPDARLFPADPSGRSVSGGFECLGPRPHRWRMTVGLEPC